MSDKETNRKYSQDKSARDYGYKQPGQIHTDTRDFNELYGSATTDPPPPPKKENKDKEDK